jgi:hypothetical protein
VVTAFRTLYEISNGIFIKLGLASNLMIAMRAFRMLQADHYMTSEVPKSSQIAGLNLVGKLLNLDPPPDLLTHEQEISRRSTLCAVPHAKLHAGPRPCPYPSQATSRALLSSASRDSHMLPNTMLDQQTCRVSLHKPSHVRYIILPSSTSRSRNSSS